VKRSKPANARRSDNPGLTVVPRAMCEGGALVPTSDQVGGTTLKLNSPRAGPYSTGD
jgi:hypothetical protein